MELSLFCKALPKIELHAHLNGSVGAETIKKLRKLKEIKDDNQQLLGFETLKEWFGAFKIIHDLTDTPEAVYLATCDVINDFKNDNVIYLELRSTPRAVDGQMTKNEYIYSIIKAIKDCAINLPEIIVKLLISVNRKQGFENAEENVKLAVKFHQDFHDCVVGIDLSGDPDEGEAYIKLFKDCRKAGLKIAAHCAEIPNEEEVVDILNFKPDRLGHCTCVHKNLGGTKKIYDMLLSSKIPVELCLSSNVKCKTVPSYSEHQFKYLFRDGHPVVIGTDDKGVFDTLLSREFEFVGKYFSLSREDLKNLSLAAVKYSFASNEEKLLLLKKVNDSELFIDK